MTQNRALQLLYDLRYLTMVLTAKGEEGKSGRGKQDSRYPFLLGLSQRSLSQMHTAPLLGKPPKIQPLIAQHISCVCFKQLVLILPPR